MSHLLTFKNDALKNADREKLAKAFSEIEGMTLDYTIKSIQNTWIQDTVDGGLIYNGKKVPLGVKFNTDTENNTIAEIVGDSYETGIDQEELTNRVSQIYQKNDIVEKCRRQRWYVRDEDIVQNEEGEYVIQAYRYA